MISTPVLILLSLTSITVKLMGSELSVVRLPKFFRIVKAFACVLQELFYILTTNLHRINTRIHIHLPFSIQELLRVLHTNDSLTLAHKPPSDQHSDPHPPPTSYSEISTLSAYGCSNIASTSNHYFSLLSIV